MCEKYVIFALNDVVVLIWPIITNHLYPPKGLL